MLRDVPHPSCASGVRREVKQEKMPTHRAGGGLGSGIGSRPRHIASRHTYMYSETPINTPVKSERFAFLDPRGITGITLGFLHMDSTKL